GRLELEETDFALGNLIADVLSPFSAAASAKNIELSSAMAETVPEFLRADPTRLRQVLTNLVSNALKFTGSGSVRVSVSREANHGENIFLHFTVADTGIGIPPEKQTSIFEAFSQGDTSITRRFGGTGLGLTICRQLVTLMGGRIWVESQVGQGSRFHFTVYGKPALRKVALARPAARPLCEPANGRVLRILVADDNIINQKVCTHLLKMVGHECEVAGTGREALVKCRDMRFDLVLMDVHMPEMDGLEATRRIRALEASVDRHTPVVGVTASAEPADLERCLLAGMDAWLTKPITLNSIEGVLARVMNGEPLAPA
ncbi:MAG TPA: ATP-binding protein, partial [Bryobacteraceae bacterium]|nr:ATP-binding protein [Bryobacteraceae bacterium]